MTIGSAASQYMEEMADPDYQNSLANNQDGKTSQRIATTHLISEGPIYGLVNGSASIFIDGDRAIPFEQSGIFASGSALTVSISGTTATINNVAAGQTVVHPPDTGEKFLIVRKAYGTATVVASQDSGDIDDSVTTKLTSTSGNFFATGMISTGEGRENPLTYFPARLIPIPGTSEFIDGLPVEGFISAVASATVASFVPAGAGQETSGLQILEGTYTLEIDKHAKISAYPGNNVLTLSASWGDGAGPWDFDVTNAQTDATEEVEEGPANAYAVATYDGITTQFRTGTIDQASFTGQGGEGSIAISHTPTGGASGALEWSSGYNDSGGSGSQSPKVLQGRSSAGFNLTEEQMKQADEARITIAYASLYAINSKGVFRGTQVWYKIEMAIQPAGSGTSFGSFFTLYENRVHQTYFAQKNSITFVETIDLSLYRPFKDFKIRISRKTDHTQSNAYYFEGNINKGRWNNDQQAVASEISGVTTIIKENLNYPYSAMGKVTFSSKDFQSAPTITYHCRGKLIKVPSNYVTREEATDGNAKYTRNSAGTITNTYQDWNGAFREKLVYTNNPAWIYYDLLLNKRYGLGEFLTEFDIDKYALYRIGRYCDELVTGTDGTVEPRFTSNLYFTKPTDSYKVLKDLATTFRSMLYYLDGKVTLIQDSPTGAIYTFNKSNVIDGQFSYEGTGSKTRANQIVVSWNDPSNAYKQSSLIIEDGINIAETGKIIKTSAIAFGCTSEGQAARYGRWKLWTAANQQEIVSFKTALNAAFLIPGDIINVQDSDRNANRYSGRVSNSTPRSTTQITLDKSLTLLSGMSYKLAVSFSKSTALAKEAVAITISGTTVNYALGDSILQAYLDGTQAEVGAASSASQTLHLTATNPNISTNDVVTGPGISGTVTVTNISGTQLTLSSNQTIAKGALLFFGVNGTYTAGTIYNEYDSLNAKASASATDGLLLEWSEDSRIEFRDVTTSTGTTSTLTVGTAFSETPAVEAIWLLTETTSEGLLSQSSGKDYKILAIGEVGKQEYQVSAVEHYNEKFDAVDTDFTTYLEDSVFVPVTEEDIIPIPIDVYASSRVSITGEGEDITVNWKAPAGTNEGMYEFLLGFELLHNIPDQDDVPLLNENVNSHTFFGVERGIFTFSVRVINTLKNKSRPVSAVLEVTPRFQDMSIPRGPQGIPIGGLTNRANTLSTAGLFAFSDSIYSIQPPGSGGSTFTNGSTQTGTFQQSCADLPTSTVSVGSTTGAFNTDHYYIYLDASDATDRLKLIKYHTGVPDGSDFGYPYWYDAGTGNTNPSNASPDAAMSSLSGTIQKAANRARVTGSSTAFTTELQAGSVIKAGTFYGRVAHIKDNTTLFLEESLSTAVSAGTSAKTNNLKIDYSNDLILGRVWKYNSVFNYENKLSVASFQTGQAVNTVSIYRLNNSTLNSTTAGTFEDPYAGNSSWSATPLSLTNNGDIVYISQRTFTSDGLSPQTANWSTPAIFARRVDGTGTTTAIGDLSAEQVNINATNAGTPLSGALAAATTTFSIIQGGSDVSSAWTFNTPTASSGVTISVSNGNREIAVTAMTNTTTSGTVTFEAVNSGHTITKVFTISKTNAAADGTPATSFNLVSTTALKKSLSNTFTPNQITATATRKIGSAATQTMPNLTSTINLYLNGTNNITASSQSGTLVYPSSGSIPANTTQVKVDMLVGTTIVDTETIIVVDDGPVTIAQDGITADLTNGVHSIPADKDGLNGNYTGATCTMNIFEGTANTTSNWTISQTVSSSSGTGAASGITVTASNNNATATVTNMGQTITTGTVIFTATRSGYSALTLTFTVNKINAGEDGTPATVFNIISSASAISKDVNNVYNPSLITATPKKVVGNAAPVTTSTSDGVTMSIFKNSTGNAVQTSNNGAATLDPITEDTNNIKLQLTTIVNGATVVLDEEIIPVVEDGQTGQASTVYEIDTTATAIILLNSGSFDPSSWTVSAFQIVGSGARTSYNVSGSGGTINFYKNGSANAETGSSITVSGNNSTIDISDGTTSLKAELVANNVIVASQTIRVTSEANDGTSGIAFIFDPTPIDTNNNGSPGPRNTTSDIAAITAVLSSPSTGQIVVVQTSATSNDQIAYRYSGTAWISIALINTGLIVTNAVKSEQLEISTSTGHSRIFMDGANNRIDVYDAGSNLRVRLGNL